uniref:Adhesion G protein-coupled receptor B2 n=1 Tax=Gasterosteus aculeatus aculeatus TaxID=481459 RepID=A0AAQ4QYG2_GASAC
MNTAGGVCLSVLSSLLALAGALAAWSALALAPLSALAESAHGAAHGAPDTGVKGSPSPAAQQCSSLVAGVLYGSFSLRELFPSRAAGCSWSLENPDPTKYSLYLRFTRQPVICRTHSPMLLSLDHHLANQSCPLHLHEAAPKDQEVIDLCGSQSNSEAPYSFLQFDKNFVQICLTRHPAEDALQVSKDLLELRLVEVLLINNENSSQFTCGVLCRWFEECLRTGHNGDRGLSDADGCAMTQTGCICPNHNIMAPPIPLLPETPHSPSNGSPHSQADAVLHQPDSTSLFVSTADGEDPYDEDDLKVKTQRPRSADQPGVFQAQTGDPAAEEWSQWSVCSLTCGQGWQVRTRSCVSSPYGTLCSGALRETRMCNNTATLEGQWLEWGLWSRCSVTCNTGSEQRQRRCSASVHGWAECKGPHQESRECTNPSCSNWGNWNHWSLCSKTCDSGSQRRFRMCEGSGLQGYQCDGSGEEVRSCNEKKCPAPHEICKEEHLLSMSWKRASAGETVYNKCPTNTTGSASRRCMLDNNGVAFWGPPSFARCVSFEYRHLHVSLREHLAKGQRTLAGEGMSQIVRSLLELLQRRSYYSGDLLFSTEILRNVTDTFKRATYIPATDDVQKFFQVLSLMLDMENLEKWEDAHQVTPGAALLMRIIEDFIHLIGEAQKPFQSFLVVTSNLMITVQREPVSAVSSDINFPMKGRRGMKDWARTAEDKLYIPKEVFVTPAEGKQDKYERTETETEAEPESPMYYVIGAILYRTLGVILPSRDRSQQPLFVSPLCPPFLPTSREAGAENWGTEGCQTLASTTVHTKCLCSRISTYAVLAQQAKDPVSHLMPSLPLMVGCGVSCTALLILLLIYAAFWRYIRSERSIILVNFCLSILASNLLILVGQSQTLSKGLCTVTAAFLHFFFLASFCWVLTEAWQSYLAVLGKMRSRLIRKRFLCLGWGLPALVVAVSVGFTRARGYGTASYCWLSLEGGLLYAFVGPAAVIVLVNMLIGIVVFNKLMSRDGISDKSKKQRAGASLWSSCVVLPLLALTWMSAVLAITDRRSTLFQVLFAVFDSVQGFVIITVHCAMRREVQDAVRCRMGGCKDDSENSPDSCKNGQVQIMTDFEKDVDLACQTVIFKEVNTCNPATITGTLSRISLDEEDDPKLASHQEGGRPWPGVRGQASQHRQWTTLRSPLPPRPLTLHPAENEAYPADFVPSSVGEMNIAMNLNRSYGTIKTMPHGHSHVMAPGGLVHSHGGHMHPHGHSLQLKPGQRPSVRQILTGGTTVERTRTLPRNLGSTNANSGLSAGSLEVGERLREGGKVMHTRKRHSELYHELNHSSKFHTIDRYSRDPAMSTFKVRPLSKGGTGTRWIQTPPPPPSSLCHKPRNPIELTSARIKIAVGCGKKRKSELECHLKSSI